jgi:hypothetical protein
MGGWPAIGLGTPANLYLFKSDQRSANYITIILFINLNEFKTEFIYFVLKFCQVVRKPNVKFILLQIESLQYR